MALAEAFQDRCSKIIAGKTALGAHLAFQPSFSSNCSFASPLRIKAASSQEATWHHKATLFEISKTPWERLMSAFNAAEDRHNSGNRGDACCDRLFRRASGEYLPGRIRHCCGVPCESGGYRRRCDPVRMRPDEHDVFCSGRDPHWWRNHGNHCTRSLREVWDVRERASGCARRKRALRWPRL
jgi:hypothetical protein